MAGNTPLRAFVSSATADEGDSQERTAEIDDIEVTFVLPDINQVILSTMMIEQATSNIEAGAALINVFFGLIKPEEVARNLDGEEVDEDDDGPQFTDFTARKLQAKMMDPHDKFGIETIAEVMMWLLEEWSSRPTTPSSPSAASPSKPGKTSKGKQRGEGSTRGSTGR